MRLHHTLHRTSRDSRIRRRPTRPQHRQRLRRRQRMRSRRRRMNAKHGRPPAREKVTHGLYRRAKRKRSAFNRINPSASR